jgi:RNA polymerase sigma factor (sigma-70 family)
MAVSLLFLARQISPPTVADRELLDRFSHTRDHDAFAELVKRHGPVVYRICRRLVGTAAADDAFQATFLLLATRTAAAKAANSVGGWLVGVAGRVARQIRRAAQRRQFHESSAADQVRVESTDSTPELLDQFRILDEELSRLPDHLRDPMVSCLLQGHTQEEAAAESGHTTRTIRRRLEEAKRLMRVRLLRRGVTPAVSAGLVAGFASVSTAVPDGLATRTVEVVFDFLTGGAAIASPPVMLAKGVATTMLARKVMAMMVVIALGLTSLGIVLAEDPKPASDPTTAKAPDPRIAPVQTLPTAPTPIQLAQKLKAGEPQVVIEALCMQATGGFCEESGLTVDDPKTGEMSSPIVATLSPREVKMMTALIRGLKAQERVDILSRPHISVLENQTGFLQVGQTVDQSALAEASTPAEAPKYSGKPVLTRTITKASDAWGPNASVQVTPRIDKDSGKIRLRVHVKTTGVSALTVETIEVKAEAMLSSDEALAIGHTIGSTRDKAQKTELLWILTPHVIRAKP